MSSNKFFSVIALTFFLFVVVFGSIGCGGGGSSSNFADNNNDNPAPSPDPDPMPTPAPVPNPTPEPTPNNSFTVTFDSNGGTEIPSQSVPSGGTVTKPNIPEKDANIFVGWYTNNNFETIFLFGENGDKVTQDITLYAKWIATDLLQIQNALSEITIGYAKGDSDKSITKNLTLPAKFGEVSITWSGGNSVIASNGTVTRPEGNDRNIVLTATATYGTEKGTRDFEVNVIHKPTRMNNEIKAISLDEVVSKDVYILYNDTGNQVTDVEGNYSLFKIDNVDDALDAITVIRNDLGIKNPNAELATYLVTKDETGTEYQFQQEYNGIKVFGHAIMASANSSGEGDFLHSNILASELLENKLGAIDISTFQSSAAKLAAENYFSVNVKATQNEPELIVYAQEDYIESPIYAYIVNVSGLNANGSYIDENVIVNASTNKVIRSNTNICDAGMQYSSTEQVGGLDEYDDFRTFPVSLVYETEPYYIMRDLGMPNIKVYHGNLPNIVKHEVNTYWNDRQQVSAYANMREVIKWWRDKFGRNSLDDKGMTVQVIAHQNFWLDKDRIPVKNNAAWNVQRKIIYFCDAEGNCNFSCAAAIDVVTHETTHAVVQFTIPGGLPYYNATGAINEAYADIFGCLKDHNWTNAEGVYKQYTDKELISFRNIKNPSDKNAQSRLNITGNIEEIYDIYRNVVPTDSNDKNGVHSYCLIISHAAYLMHKNGISWDNLGKIWYKSMQMGLSMPDFGSVRRCVVNAAKKYHMSPSDIKIIEDAFTAVGISKGTISGIVTEYPDTDKTLEDVTVTLLQKQVDDDNNESHRIVRKMKTAENGLYSFEAEEGTYTLRFEKKGYRDTQVLVELKNDTNVRQDAFMLMNTGLTIGGTVRDSAKKEPVAGVTVKLRRGLNNQVDDPIATETTDLDGKYSFELDEEDSAKFTIECVKEGYSIATINVNAEIGNLQEYDAYITKKSTNIDVANVPVNEDYFPDSVMRNYVKQFDNNEDGILSRAERNSITKLDLNSLRINSISGIEYFTSITILDCSNNNITELDTSSFTNLTTLNCSSNKLTRLDASNNPLLSSLSFGYNNITELDVSNCSSLRDLSDLSYSTNPIAMVNVNNCTSLTKLDIASNALTELKAQNCKSLNSLTIASKQIKKIDIKSCSALTNFTIKDRELLTELDAENCTALETLDCRNNNLVILNVNDCHALKTLTCSGNTLRELDVSTSPKLETLYCQGNKITSINLTNCSSLKRLDCYSNQLTVLELRECSSLTDLDCKSNLLPRLDLTVCASLINVDCSQNSLTELKAAKSPQLKKLSCSKNNLPELDMNTCISLEQITYSDNPIKKLTLSKCTALESIKYNYAPEVEEIIAEDCTALKSVNWEDIGSLENLNVRNCTALKTITCGENKLTTLNAENCTALTTLSCFRNNLTSLNISGCTSLEELYCEENKLTSLNVKNYALLKQLNCEDNALQELDLSGCSSLVTVRCSQNNISNLNLTGCSHMFSIFCVSNNISYLDISMCPILNILDGRENHLPYIDVSQNKNLNQTRLQNQTVTGYSVSETGNPAMPYKFDFRQCIPADKIHNIYPTTEKTLINRINVQLKGYNGDIEIYTEYSNGVATFASKPSRITYGYNVMNNNYMNVTVNLSEIKASNLKSIVNETLTLEQQEANVLPLLQPVVNLNNLNTVSFLYNQNDEQNTGKIKNNNMYSIPKGGNSLIEEKGKIVAVLPEFVAEETEMYSFDISFDFKISEGTILIMHSSANHARDEDIYIFFDDNGEEISMPTLYSLDHVKMSAFLKAGETYSPTIIAVSDIQANSGGCNTGAFGSLISLASIILIKKYLR